MDPRIEMLVREYKRWSEELRVYGPKKTELRKRHIKKLEKYILKLANINSKFMDVFEEAKSYIDKPGIEA